MYVDLWKWISTIKLLNTTSTLAMLLVKGRKAHDLLGVTVRVCGVCARLSPQESIPKLAYFTSHRDPTTTVQLCRK